MICPICHSPQNYLFDTDKIRTYYRCQVCSLVFVPRDQLLSYEDEVKRYEAHQNSSEDKSYREYLSQITDATLPFLSKKDVGLDFGCGKTTLLANIYKSFSIQVDSYDLYFHPKEELFEKKYNFIILSEVIEHLHRPLEVMMKLKDVLQPTGKIFIKTKLYPADEKTFSSWFYKRDLTHVQFFDFDSLTYLAKELGMIGPQRINCPDLYCFSR